MITFLNMAFLLGLPLVAVPAIVHLLNRRQRDVIDWGAMQFLLEALPRQRRFWRMDDRMLMILRCLALLLFILAIARPMIRSRWFGTSGQRDVVLIIDNSMSTSRQTGQGLAFDQIRSKAADLLSDLHENDRVRLLLAGQTPQWLSPELLRLTPESRAELRSLLQSRKPTLASTDWARCLKEAAEALDDPQSIHGLIILTDGQAYGWRAEAGSAWRELHDEFEPARGGATVNIVNTVSSGVGVNLSITSITALRSRVGVAEPVSLTATVRNTGPESSAPATLAWSLGPAGLGISPIKGLAPGQSTAVDFEHAFTAPGVFEIRTRIDRHDALDADNNWFHVIEVVESIPVLIVDGSVRDNTIENQVTYLLAALGRQNEKENQRWRSVFVPEVIGVSAFKERDLSKYPAIVLANVSQLDPPVAGQLRTFVESGGGLWLLPGDGLDRAAFNSTFCNGPDALFSITLDNPVGDTGDEEHFTKIIPPVEHDPATLLLADTQRLDLDRIQIARHYRLTLPADDKQNSILLRLSDHTPLAVHHPLGRGHIILQGVPMGTSWSNIPLHKAFVVWVNEWLAWLASPSATPWNLKQGLPITIPLDQTYAARGDLVTPLGETIKLESELLDAHRVFHSAANTIPGHYELNVRQGNGDNRSFPIVVERDPLESDLTPLSAQQTKALATAAGLHFVTNPLEGIDAKGSVVPRSEPGWTLLLASLIGLMAVELMLAGRLSRRRLAPAEPIERQAMLQAAKLPSRVA